MCIKNNVIKIFEKIKKLFLVDEVAKKIGEAENLETEILRFLYLRSQSDGPKRVSRDEI